MHKVGRRGEEEYSVSLYASNYSLYLHHLVYIGVENKATDYVLSMPFHLYNIT